MCISGTNGPMPPYAQQTIGAGPAGAPAAQPAPVAPPAPAPIAGAAAALPSDSASTGVATLGGGAPGSMEAVLQQLQTALQQLAALIGTNPVTPPTGGGSSAGLAGPAAIAHLDAAVAAQRQQETTATQALALDPSQANQHRLSISQQTTQQLSAFTEKLRPYAASIDQAEGQLLAQLVAETNQTGKIPTALMARALMQIEGSARGLSPQLIASASRMLDVQARLSAEVDQASAQLVAQANAAGVMDPAAMQRVQLKMQQVETFGMAIKRTFDSAVQNPAAAQAKFDAAASQPTVDAMLAALA